MPYTAYFGLGMTIFFIFICGFDSFFTPFHAKIFVGDYCGMLLFIVPFIAHKLYARTWLRPLDKIDVLSGKAEVDEYELQNPYPEPRNRWEKVWFAIA